MNQNSVAPSAGQVVDASTTKPDNPPLPSRWWIVVACILAGLAVAGQAASMFRLIQIGSKLEGLETLTQEAAKLRETVSATRGELVGLRQERDKVAAELASQNAQLKQGIETMDQKRQQWSALLNKSEQSRADVAAAEQKLSDLNKIVSSLDAKAKELLPKATEYENKVASNRAILQEQASLITNSRAELSQTDAELAKSRADLRTAQEQLLKLQREASPVRDLVATRESLDRDVTQLKADVQSLTTTRDGLRKEVAEEQAKIANEIMREQDTLSTLRSKADALRTSIENLNAEQVSKKKELQDLATQTETQTKLVAVKAKEFQSSDAELKAKLEELNLIADRISRAKVEEASLLKRLADLRPVVDRKEPAQPVEALSPPPAPPAPSEPDAAKPADGKTPPSTPEPKEPPKE